MPVSPTGDILSRLSADTTQVSDLISQNVNIFLRSSIKGAGHFFFMCVMSWKLTLVTVMGFPFITFISKIYGDYYKVNRESVQKEEALRHLVSMGSYQGEKNLCPSSPFPQKLSKEVQATLAEANKVAEETISSMRTVRSFANERSEAASYHSKLLLMFQLNKKEALAYACYMWSSYVSTETRRSLPFVPSASSAELLCLFQISQLGLEVAVIYYGGHLVISNQMTSGELIAFFIYVLELAECLEVFHLFILNDWMKMTSLPHMCCVS